METWRAIAQPHTDAQIFWIEPDQLMDYWQKFQQRWAQFYAMQ